MSAKLSRKGFIAGAVGALTTLAGCTRQNPTLVPETEESATTEAAPKVDLKEFAALAFDSKAWHYDAEHDAWWQLGLTYCTKPATSTYETLAIYVPGAYLKPVDTKADLSEVQESDTFECELNTSATIGSFTPKTAPIVMPINAPDYAAQTPASGYLFEGLDAYLDAGLVYVYAGFRGRSNGYDNNATKGDGFFVGGCPWAVCELKAAVRYLRYNAEAIPGDTNRIIAFGLGSGGLLAQVLGATGSSELYTPYLEEVGAATHDAEGNTFGDEICGVASWCPDAAPAHADEAYEWELGQFAPLEGTRAQGQWTQLLSNDLAAGYAAYVNSLGLSTKESGKLTLDETDGGMYTDGTYYEYLISVAASSAANFLSNTEFPASIGGVDQPSGYFPGSGKTVDDMEATFAPASAGTQANGAGTDSQSDSDALSSEDTYPADNKLTFETRSDYIAALNSNYRWINYNESKESVRIAGLSSYVSQCRAPSLGAPAFDELERGGENNQLFGTADEETLHFSQDIADQLAEHADTYAEAEGYTDEVAQAWTSDLEQLDSLDTSIAIRCSMYDPLYFVSGSEDGFGKAEVAPHWRINVGIAQTTTPLTASINLALALEAYDGVDDVAFTSVWAAPRSLAERGGVSAPEAFTGWVSSLFND